MYPFRTSSYGEIGQVYPFCSYNTILNAYFDTYGIEVFYYLKIKELQTLFPFVELKKMHISSIIIKEKLLFTEVNMEIIKISTKDADRIAHLVSAFRIQLKSYKGIKSKPNVEAGKEEILEFLQSGFPVYAVEDNGTFVGYIVCRIEKPCLWVEHIYVREDYRRKGVATMLFNKAEEIAASMGEDTVYNFVHPNNEGMIQFLRSKGYTVLNMIEIRKPYKGEKLTTTVHVEKEAFDY